MTARAKGIFWIFASFIFWGFSPLYWKLLAQVPPLEVMAHRTFWSAVCLSPLLFLAPNRREVVALFGPRKRDLAWLVLSGFLIVYNWYNFVYAMLTKQVLQSSLGYFLNPLITILLGMIFLKERLRTSQQASLALAVIAVGYLIVRGGEVPALALILASTFAVYGLIRKQVQISGLSGVFVETALASPFIFPVVWSGIQAGYSVKIWCLLVLSGPVTALPLIWYIWGVQAIPLSFSGILQFLVPVLQFALAVFLYGEAFDASRQVAFSLIWVAILLWLVPMVRRASRS